MYANWTLPVVGVSSLSLWRLESIIILMRAGLGLSSAYSSSLCYVRNRPYLDESLF